MNEADQRDSRRAENAGDLDTITGGIIDAAIQIHRDLGPGLLESVYEALLARSL